MDVTEKQILERLDRIIHDYNRVIIVKKNSDSQYLISKLSRKIREDSGNVLIVTNDIFVEDVCVNVVTDPEIELYCKLYFTYEFSDRFTVITGSGQYPSLFNYLSTGILTEEEILEAILQ